MISGYRFLVCWGFWDMCNPPFFTTCSRWTNAASVWLQIVSTPIHWRWMGFHLWQYLNSPIWFKIFLQNTNLLHQLSFEEIYFLHPHVGQKSYGGCQGGLWHLRSGSAHYMSQVSLGLGRCLWLGRDLSLFRHWNGHYLFKVTKTNPG